MKIYKIVPRFSPRTGKPIGEERVLAGERCDFSGKMVDESTGSPHYAVDHGNHDPCFGSDSEEYAFGQKNDINMHEFLADSYVFSNDWNEGDVQEAAFLLWFAENLVKLDITTIEGALRHVRVQTAQRLIDSGEVKLEELSGRDE